IRYLIVTGVQTCALPISHVAPIFGSRYLIDRTHLGPGEVRRAGVQRLIRGADMFQLFWSSNSMRSSEVASEIDYAISLRRPNFRSEERRVGIVVSAELVA